MLLLPAPVWAQSQIGELFVSEPGAPTAVRPAGTGLSVVNGSQLSAGIAPATLRLARGGQVRLCASTNLSVNAAGQGQGMMLGMGVGALEIDYRLSQGATDFLVTPDFNLRLAGPGTYHFAVGVNSKGDTCFRPLAGNSSGVVLSELLGSDSYGVSADESAAFSGGRLSARAELKKEDACGCPPPPMPVMRTNAQPDLPATRGNNGTTASALPAIASVSEQAPAETPGQTPVQVETPFVFSATGPRPNTVARVEFSSLPNVYFAQETVDPVVLVEKPAEVSKKEAKPAPSPEARQEAKGKEAKKDTQEANKDTQETKKEDKTEKKGFMARLKGFFGSMFRR
jgi:hypothetical protein